MKYDYEIFKEEAINLSLKSSNENNFKFNMIQPTNSVLVYIILLIEMLI